jgi:hypothetical protein
VARAAPSETTTPAATGGPPRPWRRAGDGHRLLLRVRVTPKAAFDKVEGLAETPDGPAVQVKVRAAPADGTANRAVLETIADWLGRPKSSLALAVGAKSRIKMVALDATPENVGLLEQRCATLAA